MYVNRIKEQAGLPKKLTAMDMRRTAITEMVEAGVDITQIKQVSGHANIQSLTPYIKHTFTGASEALAQRNAFKERGMTIWQQHRDYAEEVSRNGPYRGDCPFCNSKNTFTAETKMGVLKYNCFKLSCDVGGRFDTDMTRQEMESYFVKPLVETYSDTKEETFVYPENVVDGSQVTDGHLRRFVSRWPVLEHENFTV